MRPKVDHTGHIEMNHAHLPPSISIQLVLLDNLYPISDLEGDLVRVLGMKIVERIYVFRHLRGELVLGGVGERVTKQESRARGVKQEDQSFLNAPPAAPLH